MYILPISRAMNKEKGKKSKMELTAPDDVGTKEKMKLKYQSVPHLRS